MIYPFSNRISGCLLTALALMQLVPATAYTIVAGKPAQSAATAANPHTNTVVVPIHGEDYGERSAQFWKWEFSLPVSNHPLFINSGVVDCTAGQSGSVWFIGGTFSTNPDPNNPTVTLGQADRTCTIPSGKALFFPIVNSECSTINGDNLGDTSEKGLRACAMFFANFINPNTLSATVDGVALTALSQYRVQSPQFSFGPLPNDNIFQFFALTAPAGTTARSVSDGVHLMLYPLSPGAHTIHFHGEADFPDGSKFIEDITYHLTVMH